MLNKQELIERSKVYFENNEKLQLIHATQDGNFFFPENLCDARNHERSNSMLTIVDIKRSDVLGKVEDEVEITVDEITVDEIKDFLKSKDVKFHAKLGEKKLRVLYEEHKND